MAATEFGDTCPYLKIAQKHDVPYEVMLQIADYTTHKRDPIGEDLIEKHFGVVGALVPELLLDVINQALRFQRLGTGEDTL